MLPLTGTTITCAGTLCLLLVYYAYTVYTSRSSKYPPGPRSLPLVGNLFDLREQSPWETYQKWAATYGDLISINIFRRRIMIINSFPVALDLLNKRSSIYSDRPDLEMLKLMGWDFNLAFLRFHDTRFNRYRWMMQQNLGPLSMSTIEPMLAQKADAFLVKLSQSPDNFVPHVTAYIASMVLHYTYGFDDWETCQYLVYDIALEAISKMSESVFFGAQAVFAFPWLKYLPPWFPGAGFKRLAVEQLSMTCRMRDEPLRMVKEQMATGEYAESFVSNMLEGKSRRKSSAPTAAPTEEDIKNVAAVILTGGFHTTSSSIQSVILALTLNPHVQRRAQDEIEQVIGRTRLPDFSDRPSLPYISAICREVLRWHPPIPLAGHAVTETDEYMGYEIPKDSTVMVNIWAICRDSRLFKDADKFVPERFINPDGTLAEDNAAFSAAWGFGRRTCPGRAFAESAMWIAVARLIALFRFSPKKDASGCDIEVQEAYKNFGLFIQPESFQCSISPRSEDAQILLNELGDSLQ